MFLSFEVRSCPASVLALAFIPVSAERQDQAPQLRLGKHSPGQDPGRAGYPGMVLSGSPSIPGVLASCFPPYPSRYPGPCQRNILVTSFIFLTKGLHIIICLTKTKVLVSEFEKHFPRINGKESLINMFLKTKAKHVLKASVFPVSFVPLLLRAKAGPHAPSPTFLSLYCLSGGFLHWPPGSPGRGAWQPWTCVTSTRQGPPHLSPGKVHVAGDRADAILIATQA